MNREFPVENGDVVAFEERSMARLGPLRLEEHGDDVAAPASGDEGVGLA